MMLIQIVILMFIAYVVFRLIMKLVKKELTAQMFALWSLFWIIIALFALFPDFLSFISRKLGVGRGVDVAIYASILILFYTVFRILIRLESIDRKISDLVRKVAIHNAKNFDEKNNDHL
jgi:small membrane protein